MRLTEIQEGPISEVKKLLMTWIKDIDTYCSRHYDNHGQSKKCVSNVKERPDPLIMLSVLLALSGLNH